MGVMTMAEAWPPAGQLLTVDDLDRTPDDGRRYELVDGVLVMSPAPGIPHQEAVSELLVLLREVCPHGLRTVAGAAVQMSLSTELIPDIVTVRFDDFRGPRITGAPLLAVEVQSSSTRMFDRSLKKSLYQDFGVGSYWIVVPDVEKPELIAFELHHGRYEETAHVTGDQVFRTQRPFPFEVSPERLVAGLLPY
jgi:Uma2 family endonuclease